MGKLTSLMTPSEKELYNKRAREKRVRDKVNKPDKVAADLKKRSQTKKDKLARDSRSAEHQNEMNRKAYHRPIDILMQGE